MIRPTVFIVLLHVLYEYVFIDLLKINHTQFSPFQCLGFIICLPTSCFDIYKRLRPQSQFKCLFKLNMLAWKELNLKYSERRKTVHGKILPSLRNER